MKHAHQNEQMSPQELSASIYALINLQEPNLSELFPDEIETLKRYQENKVSISEVELALKSLQSNLLQTA